MEEIFGEQARAFDEAFKLIGGIAIEHAKIEEMLDYLLWQLTCYEISQRRGSTGKPRQELQSLFRRTRQTIIRAHRVMGQRVSLISKQLAQPRIRDRLSEITYKDFAVAWPSLQTRLVNAAEQRRDIIHSAIDWSGGEHLRRSVKFAVDSLLEGDGFEPSVPRKRNNFSRPPPFDPPQFAFRKRNRLLRTRNRWFESTSLQRGVHCEPDFRGRELPGSLSAHHAQREGGLALMADQ